MTVPDFFQMETADARRKQLKWLKNHLDLDAAFFGKVLQVDSQRIVDWLSGGQPLDTSSDAHLADLWRMFLHLLSFTNFEYSKARELLDAEAEPLPAMISCPDYLPWAGGTMKGYLEENGPDGVQQVTSWLMSFRFTDRNAPQLQASCHSLTAQP